VTNGRRTRVLIVDDSAIVRKVLSETLSHEQDIEVVGVAPDAFVAREKILSLKPDVITLDIEMPRMDGLTFLKRLMRYHPMPVVVISSLGQASCESAIEALRAGAVEVLAKPGGPYSVGDLRQELGPRIRAAVQARVRSAPSGASEPVKTVMAPFERGLSSAVIAIGASTGGTEAVADILMRMPENSPGILIVQHIPATFSTSFAQRLDRTCAMQVREARDRDECVAGVALIAPGNYHMSLRADGAKRYVVLDSKARVHYHRPSVDVLFQSVADAVGGNAVGILLTGMGVDGAKGLLSLRHRGAITIAQDESSSVVFGMPREAIRLKAADQGTPLSQIPMVVTQALRRKLEVLTAGG
jgi:two-component system chemotaxis response regulator CheB